MSLSNIPFIPILNWKGDGGLDRLIAPLNHEGDDYLVIDHDKTRTGDCKWFLTWFAPGAHKGLVLQSDVDVQGLKVYARTWVGDDDYEDNDDRHDDEDDDDE
jgi:hypothetical protein